MLQAVTASDPAGSYVDWGVIHISVSNLLIILAMVLVFVLAIVLPFPGAGGGDRTREAPARHDDRGER
jgi:hypothetical protein